MELRERHVGDVVVVDLKGQLTLADGGQELKDKINRLLHQGLRRVALNLADVPYIDSGGLGQLLASLSTVKRHDGSLTIFNLGERSKDLLSTTKLLMVFDTYDSEGEALQGSAEMA